jgi:hypothetical protein
MAFTRPWDNNIPADTQAANLLGQNIRRDKEDTAERIGAFGAGKIANRETPEADFGNANIGALFFAEDEGKLYRWTGSAWSLVSINRTFVDSSLVTVSSITAGDGNQISIPGNFLVTGCYIRVVARYKMTVAAGGPPTALLEFGATEILAYSDSGAFQNTIRGLLTADVIIVGSSSQRAIGQGSAGFNVPVKISGTEPTESIASTITVKSGIKNGSGTGTIEFDMLVVTVSKG